MHPQQICKDIHSMGSRFVLEGGDLYIENPENIHSEIESLIKSYKPRIIKFLKGEYSNSEYAVDQTTEKILRYFTGEDQDVNSKINAWLIEDSDSVKDIMTLIEMLTKNGWNAHEPIDNYKDFAIGEISQVLFDKAMAFFRGG